MAPATAVPPPAPVAPPEPVLPPRPAAPPVAVEPPVCELPPVLVPPPPVVPVLCVVPPVGPVLPAAPVPPVPPREVEEVPPVAEEPPPVPGFEVPPDLLEVEEVPPVAEELPPVAGFEVAPDPPEGLPPCEVVALPPAPPVPPVPGPVCGVEELEQDTEAAMRPRTAIEKVEFFIGETPNMYSWNWRGGPRTFEPTTEANRWWQHVDKRPSCFGSPTNRSGCVISGRHCPPVHLPIIPRSGAGYVRHTIAVIGRTG